MEDLLGFFLELVVEVLIQLLFEGSIAVALRAPRRENSNARPAGTPRRFRFAPYVRVMLSQTNPPLTILKFSLLGLGLGFVSVLVLPHPLVHPSKLHGIGLLISPVVTGMIMGFTGRMVRRRGKTPVRIESFACGFTFAIAFALIRFFIVH